jgi:hypothetical protein
MKRFILYVSMLVLVWCCKTKDENADQPISVEEDKLMSWKETDTIHLPTIPEGLASWITYYQKSDPAFSLGHFKASGVVLHFDGLPDAISKGDERSFEKYFQYAPDSASYIDMFSYDHFMDKGMLTDGEADQQVVLGSGKKGIRKQLMFNGPSQSVDFADWLSNNSFIIGTTAVSEDGKSMNAQLMIFRLTDSSFTNFDLDHRIPMNSLVPAPQGFSEMYINKLQEK